MKTNQTLFLLLILIMSCSGQKSKESASVSANFSDTTEIQQTVWYEGAVPFEFNVKNEYPETNIRLSDLADISYVQLGLNDEFLMRGVMSCNGCDFHMTQDRIYMHESDYQFFIFDRQGNPVRKLNRRGGGPGEFNFIQSYVADTVRQELFVLDGHNAKIFVYDTATIFKREFNSPAYEIRNLNDSLLICYNQYNPGGAHYTVVSKENGKVIKDCPIRFNIKLPEDTRGRLAFGSVIPNSRGAFLSNLRNDTIFQITRNLDVYPRFIDKSNYGTNFAQAHPTIETNRYLLFYILRSHTYRPVVDQNYYMYDKKEKQIYKMKEYADNSFFALMDNYPHVNNWFVTQNHNTAICLRTADALLDSEGHCHGQLDEIRKTLTGEENPVLIIMDFKASE